MRQSTTGRRTIHRKHLAFNINQTSNNNQSIAGLPVVEVIAGESITEGNAVVVLQTTSGLRAFNAKNVSSHYHYIGIASNSSTAGSVCAIIDTGSHSSLRYNFTPGSVLYITTSALNITSVLLPHQHTFQIGVAVSETTILIKPDVRVINNTGE